MNANTAKAGVISSDELRAHWQGHRGLTRRVIAAFPEKEFFEFSIGGMRTAAELTMELIAVGAPGLRQIAHRTTEELSEEPAFKTKSQALELWDQGSAEIDRLWAQIPEDRFGEEVVTFGKYPGTVQSSILYFIDNEIHHRGQMYVYLRALGVEPPYFWER